jgi:hypothetical protein
MVIGDPMNKKLIFWIVWTCIAIYIVCSVLFFSQIGVGGFLFCAIFMLEGYFAYKETRMVNAEKAYYRKRGKLHIFRRISFARAAFFFLLGIVDILLHVFD